jgi:hypothetical protein
VLWERGRGGHGVVLACRKQPRVKKEIPLERGAGRNLKAVGDVGLVREAGHHELSHALDEFAVGWCERLHRCELDRDVAVRSIVGFIRLNDGILPIEVDRYPMHTSQRRGYPRNAESRLCLAGQADPELTHYAVPPEAAIRQRHPAGVSVSGGRTPLIEEPNYEQG